MPGKRHRTYTSSINNVRRIRQPAPDDIKATKQKNHHTKIMVIKKQKAKMSTKCLDQAECIMHRAQQQPATYQVSNSINNERLIRKRVPSEHNFLSAKPALSEGSTSAKWPSSFSVVIKRTYVSLSTGIHLLLFFTIIAAHIAHGGSVIAQDKTTMGGMRVGVLEHQRVTRKAHHHLPPAFARPKRATEFSQPLTFTSASSVGEGGVVGGGGGGVFSSEGGHWATSAATYVDDNNNFRPIIPQGINAAEFIAQNVFTETGQYRVFQPPSSDLRQAQAMGRKIDNTEINKQIAISHNKAENMATTISKGGNSRVTSEFIKILDKQEIVTNKSDKGKTTMQTETAKAVTKQALHMAAEKVRDHLRTNDNQSEILQNKLRTTLNKWKNFTQTNDNNKSLPEKRGETLTIKSLKIEEEQARKMQRNEEEIKEQNLTKATIGKTTAPIVAAPTTSADATAAADEAVNITQNSTPSNDMHDLEELLLAYAVQFFNHAQYLPNDELINALQKNHTTNNHANNSATANENENDAGAYKKRPTRHVDANAYHHYHSHHHAHHHQHQYQYQNQHRKRQLLLPRQQVHHPQQQHHHHLTPPAITRRADGAVSANIPRAMTSGRLLLSSGLKKMLWPIFMGLQVLKSLLFALFLPTLIGSFGKILGKGIVSGSAPLFIRPADAPQDLDFRDNTINFDDDKFAVVDDSNKDDGYPYNHAEATQTQYTYNTAAINHRIEQQQQQNKMPDTYLSALQTIGSASFKNSGSLSGSSSNNGIGGGLFGGGGGLGAPLRNKPAAAANTNNFQTFQKVPASSLLLSNYDPFYSPLLSRLDSVFAALKLNSDKENCREKLICLMYANPAKYAPYSNLVSAQLSRELNELRKPTSDNPDILRFFKYMRAAKDGQDGIDCEKSFDQCKEFKDFENPAMVSTYHDINKLVQARKLA